jgi:hypothetical protein
MRGRKPNERSALDAGTGVCTRIEAHWPGASESERWARRVPSAVKGQGSEQRLKSARRRDRLEA